MKFNRLVAVAFGAAMLMSAATAASAAVADVLIQGVVFFGATTPTTAYSAPGSQIYFSFDVPSTFTAPSTFDVTNSLYELNGVKIATPIEEIHFYDVGEHGMFDIIFPGHLISIYGPDVGSGGTITGSGFYDVTAGVDDSFPGTGVGGVTIDPPAAVPEPATWLTMAMGVGVLGFALRRRGAQAALAA